MKATFVSLAGLLLVAGGGPAADAKVGDVVVVITPTDLRPAKGEPTRLSPGTCLTVTKDGLTVSMGKVGRIDPAAVVPLAAATAHFTRRIEANPRDAAAWLARGKVAFHRNELDRAIADLDESLRLAPASEALAIRGFAWKRKGDKDKAMADFDAAIKLDPREALAWRVRGATWAGKAEYAKALADYTEAIRVDPDNPDALHHRVNLLAGCTVDQYRDGKQAVADATRACELTGYANPLYVVGLGAAHAEVGDFEAAVRWHTKAMALVPAGQAKAMQARIDQYKDGKPFRMTWK